MSFEGLERYSKRGIERFFRSNHGIQILALLLAFLGWFFPDILNYFLERLGNKPEQLGNAFNLAFKLFMSTMAYLITYYNAQFNRLSEQYKAHIGTFNSQIESAATSLRHDIRSQMWDDLQIQSMDTLLARHGTDARTAPYLCKFIDSINSVLHAKSPNLRRAALALLELSIEQWELRVDNALIIGIDLTMDEFYRLANTLLLSTKSLLVIDSTLYTDENCFSSYFREDFIPGIQRKIGEMPESSNGYAFYTVVPHAVHTEAGKSVEWMANWWESKGIPLFLVQYKESRRRLYEQFKDQSLFIFDNEVVITMTAAEDWNKHEDCLRIRLSTLTRSMAELCQDVIKRKVLPQEFLTDRQ